MLWLVEVKRRTDLGQEFQVISKRQIRRINNVVSLLSAQGFRVCAILVIVRPRGEILRVQNVFKD